jgi:hypothetical protein
MWKRNVVGRRWLPSVLACVSRGSSFRIDEVVGMCMVCESCCVDDNLFDVFQCIEPYTCSTSTSGRTAAHLTNRQMLSLSL